MARKKRKTRGEAIEHFRQALELRPGLDEAKRALQATEQQLAAHY